MESVSRIKMPPAKPEFGNSPDDALVNLPIMPDAASNTAARVLVHGEPINASLDSLAYTLSQRRRYALLALFASTIAVDSTLSCCRSCLVLYEARLKQVPGAALFLIGHA